MTLEQTLKYGKECLINAGIRDAEVDAWYLLEHVTGYDRAYYFSHQEEMITAEQEAEYKAYVEKRTQHIPLQHLTGVQEFMGFNFKVNENVLIPRFETEFLVEDGIDILRGEFADSYRKEGKTIRVLDMCTGSGCIIITILKWMVKNQVNMEGVGVDISEKALETAKENAEAIGADVKFLKGDLFEPVTGKFELIISNPPYIRTDVIETLEAEVKDHDPYIALNGKEDGLHFYRRIVKESTEYIVPGGWLVFEIGHDQGQTVYDLMIENGYTNVEVRKDLSGLDRIVVGMYDGKVK
ncbi:MAG: peptide chain release factor N(5)-glutamine methyltransferase [Schaedlerella sp.]|nr:peptide chain release factor N(5)-glutamine methyltransferase [Schaedlerella sp.]